MDSGSKRAHRNGNVHCVIPVFCHIEPAQGPIGEIGADRGTHEATPSGNDARCAPPSLRSTQPFMAVSSRNSRRRIFPTLVLGNSVRNSIFLGRL